MKDIKGYENKYYLDVDGNVYRYIIKSKSYKQLKPMKLGEYFAIDLGLKGVIKRYLVHRLMAINYIENPENKEQVNHINGIKKDNRLINLEWNTRSENQKHSIKIGLRTTCGEKNSQSKLSANDVLKIREDNRLQKEIAKDYQVSFVTISDIKRRRSWGHL